MSDDLNNSQETTFDEDLAKLKQAFSSLNQAFLDLVECYDSEQPEDDEEKESIE